MKTWCKHIKEGFVREQQETLNVTVKKWVMDSNDIVPARWDFCPVCGRERPTKENIAAAELRFLMDNDQ